MGVKATAEHRIMVRRREYRSIVHVAPNTQAGKAKRFTTSVDRAKAVGPTSGAKGTPALPVMQEAAAEGQTLLRQRCVGGGAGPCRAGPLENAGRYIVVLRLRPGRKNMNP